MNKEDKKNQLLWMLIMGLKETAKIINSHKDNSVCIGCSCLHHCYKK